MSNNLALKKGLDIPILGAAVPEVIKTVSPDVVAVKPTDFKGLVPRLLVKEGDAVKAGDVLIVIEAMKMENDVCAPADGVVKQILVSKGALVATGDTLVVI